MKKNYNAPDFEVAEFEVEDIITISVGGNPVGGGDDGWMDLG